MLTGIHPLKVCVGYEDGTRTYKHFPSDARVLSRVRPVYEELPGWAEPLGEARSLGDLPQTARDYLEVLQEFTEVPVAIVSVGPSRHQTIVRESADRNGLAFCKGV